MEELRRLLVEKHRAQRQARLEQFRRSGRVVVVEPQPSPLGLDSFHSDLVEESVLQPVRSKSRRRVWLDRLLLLVELAAIGGLAFVFLNGFNLLSTLNQQASQAQVLPTLTPTAIIQAVVLPSGHTPPDANGNTRPNEAEIPEHLRPMVQSLANIPIPPPSLQQAVREGARQRNPRVR